MFDVQDLSIKNNSILLSFTAQKVIDSIGLELRLQDTERFLVTAYKDVVEVPVVKNGHLYEATLKIENLTEQFQLTNPAKQYIFLKVHADNEYFDLKLNANSKALIKEVGNMAVGKLAKLKLKMDKGSLSLVLDKAAIKNSLTSIQFEDNKLIVDIHSSVGGEKEGVAITTVKLKQRAFKNTLIYSDEIELDHVADNIFSLELRRIDNFSFDDDITNLDFIVSVQEKNLVLESDIKKMDEFGLPEYSNMNYKKKFYWTMSKGLSIRVEKNYHYVEADEVVIDGEKIYFFIQKKYMTNGSQLENLKCTVYRKNKLINDQELIPFKNIELCEENTHIKISFSVHDLFSEIQPSEKQQYVMLLTDGIVLYHIRAKQSFEQNTNLQSVNVDLKINKNTEIVIRESKPKAIKLGILGTCFTRSAFNSQESYFNPDYKMYFNIAYSHFWPSLISLFSAPIELNKDDYKDIPEKEFIHISREYDKSTFEALRSTGVDYLLVDFFVDALHGTRKLDDGRFLGQNGTMHKSAHYKHQILKSTSQFDYRDPEFWPKWKESCNKFISELESFIDLDRVILTWGGLTKNYYDENKEIKSFLENGRFSNTELNYYNNIWEKMNNYFLSNAPNVRVLDMRKYNYISDVRHTISCGPHHFESNYYKSLVAEIGKIISRA